MDDVSPGAPLRVLIVCTLAEVVLARRDPLIFKRVGLDAEGANPRAQQRRSPVTGSTGSSVV